MRQGLDAYRVTGAELGQPYLLSLQAEAYGRTEQAEKGLQVLAEALRVVDSIEEHWWEAELYRMQEKQTCQGECLRVMSYRKTPQNVDGPAVGQQP